MTQVSAAINHRLSEEYAGIELPNQEAKERYVDSILLPSSLVNLCNVSFCRLLADAKFLHQKLSTLKNVGAQSGMLETVIAEKNIMQRKRPRSPLPQQQPVMPFRQNSISAAAAIRGPVLTANQRLQGIFKSAPKSPVAMPAEKLLPPSPVIREKSPPSSVSDSAQISDDRAMDEAGKNEASGPPLLLRVADPPEERQGAIIEVTPQQSESGTMDEGPASLTTITTRETNAGETSGAPDVGDRSHIEAPSIAT
jgi:vacuolar protein sorting-associated protein 54